MKRKKEGEIMAEKGVHRDRNRNVNKLTNRQRSNKGYNEKKRLKQTQTKASKTPPPLPGPTGRGGGGKSLRCLSESLQTRFCYLLVAADGRSAKENLKRQYTDMTVQNDKED